MDASGNGVGGIDVTFTTSAGTLAPAIATSGTNGVATTRLTTNRDAVVVASAGTKSATITIKLAPVPTLSVSVTPTAPTAGQVAQFAFTAAAAVGGAPLRDLVIDFGDGSRTTVTGLSGTTSVGHAYANPGSYVVASTLTDVGGERAVATTILSVLPRAPLTVTIDVVGGTTPTAGNPVTFNAIVGPAAELPRVTRLEWDFGDGTTATTNGTSTSHIFTVVGPKTVSVTVVTTDGARFTSQVVILVKQAP
jgi:PKD repeat protein